LHESVQTAVVPEPLVKVKVPFGAIGAGHGATDVVALDNESPLVVVFMLIDAVVTVVVFVVVTLVPTTDVMVIVVVVEGTRPDAHSIGPT